MIINSVTWLFVCLFVCFLFFREPEERMESRENQVPLACRLVELHTNTVIKIFEFTAFVFEKKSFLNHT